MEFRFDLNELFKQPIIEVGNTLIPPGFTGDKRALWDTQSKMTQIVNAIGEASARAQGLSKPITTADRLRNSEHRLYLLMDPSANNGKGAVTGMLKTGSKGLYVFDRSGQHYQVSPQCVLDFYIHESRQRAGLGRRLFEHMLESQQLEPEKMAIDRPSDKFLGFLSKHYGLTAPVKQMNNYVVYDGFFPRSSETPPHVDVDKSAPPSKKQSANGLQQSYLPSQTYGRYGAAQRPCSMGQIIHNDSAVVHRNQEPTGVRSEPVTNVHGGAQYQYGPGNPAVWQHSQSVPNVPSNHPHSVPNHQYGQSFSMAQGDSSGPHNQPLARPKEPLIPQAFDGTLRKGVNELHNSLSVPLRRPGESIQDQLSADQARQVSDQMNGTSNLVGQQNCPVAAPPTSSSESAIYPSMGPPGTAQSVSQLASSSQAPVGNQAGWPTSQDPGHFATAYQAPAFNQGGQQNCPISAASYHAMGPGSSQSATQFATMGQYQVPQNPGQFAPAYPASTFNQMGQQSYQISALQTGSQSAGLERPQSASQLASPPQSNHPTFNQGNQPGLQSSSQVAFCQPTGPDAYPGVHPIPQFAPTQMTYSPGPPILRQEGLQSGQVSESSPGPYVADPNFPVTSLPAAPQAQHMMYSGQSGTDRVIQKDPAESPPESRAADPASDGATPKADRPNSLNIEPVEEQLSETEEEQADIDALDKVAIEEEIRKVEIAPQSSSRRGSRSPGPEAAGLMTPRGMTTPGLTDQGYFDLKFYHNKLW